MGQKGSRSEREHEYWRRKNAELWLKSRTYRKLRRIQKYLINFDSFDINMQVLNVKLYPLLYSALQIKSIQSLSLQSVDIAMDSFKDLRQVISTQDELKTLRLSFEARENDEDKYSITSLCRLISLKPKLMHLTLGNWGKINMLEVGGAMLGEVITSTPLKSLTLQKVDITEFPAFARCLPQATLLSALCLQSNRQYSKEDVRQIYEGLRNSTQIKRIEIFNKSLQPQIAWKEMGKILESTQKLKEFRINGDAAAAQNAIPALAVGLAKNTSILNLVLVSFQKCSLEKNEVLLQSLEQHSNLQKLDLSYIAVNSENIILILAQLSCMCPDLRVLILTHSFGVRTETSFPCVILMKRLCENKTIRALDLSANCFFADEEKALPMLLALNTTVQSLALSHCGLTDETMTALFLSLADSPSVVSFDVKIQHRKCDEKIYAGAGKAIAQCLAKNTVLKMLMAENNAFTDDGLLEIAASLQSNKTLEQLSLTYAGSNKNVVHAFGKAISVNTRLSQFTLYEIQPVSNTKIFQGLGMNQSLLSLEIQTAGLSTKSLKALGEALKANETLMSLRLLGRFGPDGAIPFSEGLAQNRGLKRLYLTSSEIGRKESVAFMQFLRTNRCLEHLQLYYKVLDLEDPDIKVLIEALRGNMALKFLGMGYGSLTTRAVNELKKVQRRHFWLKFEIF